MKHLTPTEAFDELQRNPDALLVDCRTEMEFFYVGHPVGAVNIEWHVAPDFHVNPQFVDQATRDAGAKDRPLRLIRRSDKCLPNRNSLSRKTYRRSAVHHRLPCGDRRRFAQRCNA